MNLLKLAKNVIDQIEKSNYVEKDTGFEHELKNNKAIHDLKKYLQSTRTNDKTDELMEKYFTKVKVESGWLYNYWDTEKDDYAKNWIYVPDMKVVRS